MSELSLAPSSDVLGLARELMLVGGGVVILLLDAFVPSLRRLSVPLGLLTVLTTALIPVSTYGAVSSFGSLLVQDGVTALLGWVVLLATLICLLASAAYLEREALPAAEYCALLLWCAAGMLIMLRGTELLTIFVALELFSICLYTLAGYHRRSTLSTESAVKYFLMGAFVSSFILYGIALLYGETGTTRLDGISMALHFGAGLSPAATLGILLLVCGFGFKLSVVPFHAWAPDAYQGAPSPFVAFFSVAPKVASVVVLIRALEVALYADPDGRWGSLIGLLAGASMIFGTLVALVQSDIKRMLAYSGIAHMGFLLIPLASWNAESWRTVIVYALAYALMNGGAFALVAVLYRSSAESYRIDDLSGWGFKFPGAAMALTLCMLSLGGIPPTLGFEAKYLVLVDALRSGHLTLALIGVLSSLAGIFYYLRVVYVLYMKEERVSPPSALDRGGRLAGGLAAAGVLLIGLFPGWLFELIERWVHG